VPVSLIFVPSSGPPAIRLRGRDGQRPLFQLADVGVVGYCESGNHVWAIVRLMVGGPADSVRRRRDL